VGACRSSTAAVCAPQQPPSPPSPTQQAAAAAREQCLLDARRCDGIAAAQRQCRSTRHGSGNGWTRARGADGSAAACLFWAHAGAANVQRGAQRAASPSHRLNPARKASIARKAGMLHRRATQRAARMEDAAQLQHQRQADGAGRQCTRACITEAAPARLPDAVPSNSDALFGQEAAYRLCCESCQAAQLHGVAAWQGHIHRCARGDSCVDIHGCGNSLRLAGGCVSGTTTRLRAAARAARRVARSGSPAALQPLRGSACLGSVPRARAQQVAQRSLSSAAAAARRLSRSVAVVQPAQAARSAHGARRVNVYRVPRGRPPLYHPLISARTHSVFALGGCAAGGPAACAACCC
jgi:hypothetical protein